MTGRLRQVCAIGMLFVAGLASLATTESPYTFDTTTLEGSAVIDTDSAEIRFATLVDWRRTWTESPVESWLWFSLGRLEPARYAIEATAEPVFETHQPIDAEVVSLADGSVSTMANGRIRVKLQSADCPGPCRSDYVVRIRRAGPALSPVVLRWQLVAEVPVRRYPTVPRDVVQLETTAQIRADPIAELVAGGAALGVAVALILGLLVWAARGRRRALAWLEAAGGAVLVATSLALVAGWLVLGLPGTPAGAAVFVLLASGLAALLAQLVIAPALTHPRVIPGLVLLGGSGVAWWALTGQPIYVAHEVVVGVAALVLGVLIAGAAALPLAGRARAAFDVAGSRVRVSSVLAAVVVGACLVLGLAWPLLSAVGVMLLAAFYMWLRGLPVAAPIISGVLVPLVVLMPVAGSMLALALRNIGSTASPAPGAPDLYTSTALLLCVASIALAMLTALPPPAARAAPPATATRAG